MTSGRPLTAVATAAVSVAAAIFAVGCHGAPVSDAQIDGPYADLLASSTDLGPAGDEHVQLTAALHGTRRPEGLFAWSGDHGLSVRWRDGDAWAVVEGPAAAMSAMASMATTVLPEPTSPCSRRLMRSPLIKSPRISDRLRR